jgi:hypothetical protein
MAHQIPNRALDILEGIPNGVIFGFFVLATAAFTGTTFSWVTCKTVTTAAHSLSWACTVICLVVWIIVGVNPEELALVCLPQSIGLGILLSCLFGGKIDGDLILDEEDDSSYDV